MSDVATARGRVSAGPWSFVAVVFAICAVAVWVLAGIVDDGLYPVAGVLGIAAFGLGLKARREARRVGTAQWPALAATIVGGLLGALVIVFSIVYGVSQAV